MKKLNSYLLCIALLFMAWGCNNTDLDSSDKVMKASVDNGDETEQTTPTVDPAEFEKFEHFDINNFDENSINITNEWMPMKPGEELLYQGVDIDDEGEEQAHTVSHIVTDMTKVIYGVNTVVLFERDYCEGELEEAELAFFAQDKAGNVWHFGQYVEHYDGEFFSGGRIWIVGPVEGAKAGIMMPASPQMNTPSYSQGFAPAPFNWTDRAEVYKVGQKVTNTSGTYDDVLMVREFSFLEPNAFQLKYYAKGIGNIGIGWTGDDPNKETMDLVKVIHHDASAMSKINEDAMKLEKRAYVYGTTPPSKDRKLVN